MKLLKSSKFRTLVLVIFYISGISISQAAKIDSNWPNKPVLIDGMQTDWQGKLYGFDDDNVNIGVMNDSSFLYILVAPTNQQVARQAMGAGMIIWIDSKSKDKFGIRYPLGIPIEEMDLRGMRNNRQGSEDFRAIHRETSLKEIQLIDKDKEIIETIPIVNLLGINIRVENRNGRFVYELQFPLHSTPESPYSVDAKVGEEIKITFETLEFNRKALKDKFRNSRAKDDGEMQLPGGMQPPSGMQPPGGMSGGRGGKMHRGETPGRKRSEISESLKLKLKVKLAKEKP